MTKIALLIGVSDYGSGFTPLPRAQRDVQAMRQILQHPEIGSFTEVRTLVNPDRQVIEEAIEALFSGRQRDNLVLLYFSGHAIKDSSGKLYLATNITRKNEQKQLVKSSVVPASFVHEATSDCRSQQQVMILDCCFSEASTAGIFTEANRFMPDAVQKDVSTAERYEHISVGTATEKIAFPKEIAPPQEVVCPQNIGWLDKDGSSIDIHHQLGGEGRVILTSSTSTPSSFEHQASGLSVYTHYLVEGMETGVADRDNDGAISIEELHEYASRKARIATPVMQPRIYRVENYHQIILAKVPANDPKRRYRKEVEHCANRGEISVVNRSILGVLRDSLGLLPEEAAAIEAEVLEPYREYQRKLQRYVRGFVETIHHEPSVSDDTRNGLQSFQQILGLTDADVAPVEAQVARQRESFPSPDQVVELTKTQNTTSLNHETVKPVKPLPETVAASEAATPVLTEATTSLWNRGAYPASIRAPRNFKLLVGIGIATVLAWAGVIYRFSSLTPTAPPESLLKPKPISVPEPPSSSIPTPLTPPLPKLPSKLVPESPPALAPAPSSTPEPPSSGPESPATSVAEPPPSKPEAPASKPMPRAASVAKPPPLKPKVPASKPRPAASRSRPAVPESPPISSPEPPPTSAPKTTSSSPEPPPTSWSEPPPTSAPGQNF
jgi:uncharacterized caspase-like protein